MVVLIEDVQGYDLALWGAGFRLRDEDAKLLPCFYAIRSFENGMAVTFHVSLGNEILQSRSRQRGIDSGQCADQEGIEPFASVGSGRFDKQGAVLKRGRHRIQIIAFGLGTGLFPVEIAVGLAFCNGFGAHPVDLTGPRLNSNV
jgi:hypothetical protein